jgi:hypothetical protein
VEIKEIETKATIVKIIETKKWSFERLKIKD